MPAVMARAASAASTGGARVVQLAVLLALASAASPALAREKCMVRQVIGITFGSYDVFSATPLRAAGSVAFRCNTNNTHLVRIQLGTGASGRFAPRHMRVGAATLSYNLFLDAAGANVWGDGTAGTAVYGPALAAPHTNHVVPIYGVVPPHQDVPAAAFADNVAITIVF